jgi:phosphodiesterase/alkaline phosphatase D-like protein
MAAHEHGLDHVVLTADVERWLLWAARVFSAVVLLGFGLTLLEVGAPDHGYVAWEQAASRIAFAVSALGLVVAWWWQPGAGLALVSGVFVGALAAYQHSLLSAIGVALLFMLPAALFLLAWQRTQSWLSIITVGTVMVILLVAGGALATSIYEEGHGRAHPGSSLEQLPESAVAWVWSGAVTDDAAVVTAKVPQADTVRLAYSTSAHLADPAFVVSSRRGPVHRFDLAGLEPGTRYHYAVEADGDLDTVRAGTFATFSAGQMDFSIAFGCGARTRSNGAVFDTIRSLEPNLFLSTGDFHYGDVAENSLGAFADLYDLTLTRAAQAALYRSTPIAYIWDDHDYGPNDAAGDSPSRQAALISYRDHVPHYDLALEGPDAPIGQAFTIGRVRFILTDNRSARDPKSVPDQPSKTMLGEEQLAWFLAELTDALERYPAVVWVNSVPWIAQAEKGADHWGGYTHERERIASAIANIRSDHLIMLAGDAHMLAIDDGSNNDYAPGGGSSFAVMHAAALDRIGSTKGGPYSEGAFPGGGQFGLLTVEDRGTEIRFQMQGLNWELQELVSLELVFPAEGS